MAVVLLPEPDSPTTATISRSRTAKDTPDTAVTGPLLVRKSTDSPSTRSTGSLSLVALTGHVPSPRMRPAGRRRRS